jgi:uncharacterized RDD family membrane protein YckC
LNQHAADQTGTAASTEPVFVGFWSRAISYLIDSIFLTLISMITALSAGIVIGMSNLEMINLTYLVMGLITPFYYIIFWALAGGTPGKIMLGMRIVGPNGRLNGIGFGRAIARFFGYIVSSFLFYLGFIWVAIDPEKQGWHDKIAGTHVVQV